MKEGILKELQSSKEFFDRSTNCLTEEDSTFAPQEGTLTVCQQVAHVAQCIDWFMDGIKNPEGFDMDFEKHWKDVMSCTSMSVAKEWLDKSFDSAAEIFNGMSEEELMSPLPDGPVMGGEPRLAVIGGITDHTAHHRGALTVYSRLLGKEPQMPYMDE